MTISGRKSFHGGCLGNNSLPLLFAAAARQGGQLAHGTSQGYLPAWPAGFAVILGGVRRMANGTAAKPGWMVKARHIPTKTLAASAVGERIFTTAT